MGMAKAKSRRGGIAWGSGAAAVLVVGIGLRLALGGGGVGDSSAIVMTTLLAGGAWVATLLVGTPRAAFLVTLGLVALLDLAALPVRNAPEYDARDAFFQTDQVIAAQAPIAPGRAEPTLVLLVEPVFPSAATQPSFGLAGDVGSTALAWDCAFQRGLQQLALPLPEVAVVGSESVAVRLHLTGSPARQTDYLLVYASAVRGGFLASVVGGAELAPTATRCTLH
jgi:hypothetical protein